MFQNPELSGLNESRRGTELPPKIPKEVKGDTFIPVNIMSWHTVWFISFKHGWYFFIKRIYSAVGIGHPEYKTHALDLLANMDCGLKMLLYL